MSTPSNPQMTAVLVNVSRNRIATQNDLAKSDMVLSLKALLTQKELEGANEEYLRFMENHIEAVDLKLGQPRIKEAYLPTQKFVFA